MISHSRFKSSAVRSLWGALVGALFFAVLPFFFAFFLAWCFLFSYLCCWFSVCCNGFACFLIGFCRGGRLRRFALALLVRALRGRHPRGPWLLSFGAGRGCLSCLRRCSCRLGPLFLVGCLGCGCVCCRVLGRGGGLWRCGRWLLPSLGCLLVFFNISPPFGFVL